MSVSRQRRIRVIVIVFVAAIAITALALTALRHNINVYYTPHELVKADPSTTQLTRLGGWVMPGTVKHMSKSTEVFFRVTDHLASVEVQYSGLLPSLFRENQGIVVVGYWMKSKGFRATQVLAKHDANYHPPGISTLPASEKENLNAR